MKRYIKLLTCTLFGVCGLLAFYIYQNSVDEVQPAFAFEAIQGEQNQIETLALNGAVTFYNPYRWDSFSYKDGETSFKSDQTFFNHLDSLTSIDPTVEKLRQDYPNFMRSKGLFTTQIVETGTHVVTANFVGDFDTASQSDEILIGLLDKDTGENEHFPFYSESNFSHSEQRIAGLYENLPEIHLILQFQSSSAETGDYEQIHITYNVENSTFTEERIDFSEFELSSYTFGNFYYANESLILFDRFNQKEEYFEFPLFYDFETRQLMEFPTPDGERNTDYTVEILDNDVYLFSADENSINISKANQRTEDWENVQTIATDYTPINAEIAYTYGYDKLGNITFDVKENKLIIIYLPFSNDDLNNNRIVVQVNDLETGEQTFLGNLTLENTNAYGSFELFLPQIKHF